MTDWKYYICIHCKSTLKSTIDNPDNNIKCIVCGRSKFDEISKEAYEATGVDKDNGS